ncbi:hypothetical protein [Streptomyces orinoci]|nr:hypothetical protein [Streptomyces orinoci]
MNIKRIAKRAGVAAAVAPLLLAVTAGSAHADGTVTWSMNYYPGYLSDVRGGHDITTYADTSKIPMAHVWYDIQNSDGSWNEVNANTGWCLTSYDTQVYTEPCNSAKDGTNWYQRWYEIKTDAGWKLQSRMSGYTLDGGADPTTNNVYANPKDYGNSFQRWN